MSVQIDTTIIFTTQMKELAQFYQAGLDLQVPIPTSEDHLGFPLGAVYLGFDQVAEAWQSPGAVTLWFRVDDLDATFNRFVGLGARVNYPPVDKPWGDRLASVYDLDSNLIGLSQRKEVP
jgi:predicted enzyme related to lactoylglutathione lyase